MLDRLARSLALVARNWLGINVPMDPATSRWPAGSFWPWPVRQSLARRWQDSARANFLASSSPTAASLAEKWCSHAIGTGPTVRSLHPDEGMRRALESIWSRFAMRCDQEGVDDLVGVLNTVMRSTVNAGESFIRLVTTQRGELRLQVLSPEQVDPQRNLEAETSRTIAGIEIARSGERLAYWCLPDAPDAMFAMIGPAVRVPASEIVHVFERKLPGQPRGTSWLGPIATRLLQLDELEESLLARAGTAALFSAFVRDLEGSFQRDGSTTTKTNAAGDLELSLEPGTMRVLPPGTDIVFPQVPDAGGLPDLLKHMLRSIASGGGMPYELLTGDLSDANYSSARLSLQSFQRRVRALQLSTIGNRLLQPIWERLVTLEVLSGRLAARDFERRTDQFFAVSFLWPEWPSIDPLKDAKADVLETNAGLKSRHEIIAARGRDPAEVDDEIENDEIRPDISATATAALTEPSTGENA